MSVEIVRRLLESGLVTEAELEVALLAAVIRGVPFLQTLADQRSELSAVVERELARADAPALRAVHADWELASSLPVGLCERLLAVPVRRESITGTVDVAAADPFDSHLAQEFSFHLDAPVRVLRAPASEVTAAIDGLHAGGAFVGSVSRSLSGVEKAPRSSWPAARSNVPSARPGSITSAPPIPLVQRAQSGPAHPEPPRTRVRTDPGVGRSGRTYPELKHDESGEPILGLLRSKLPDVAHPTSPNPALADLLAQAEQAIALSSTPEALVEQIVRCACPEGCTLVFNVKSHEYVARAASFEVSGLKDISVVASRPSVFSTAADNGHYLGPLPDTLTHALLRDLLATRLGQEVYVVPAGVADKPVLMILVTGFERSFTATKRADQIAEFASLALRRILEDKKRGQRPLDGA